MIGPLIVALRTELWICDNLAGLAHSAGGILLLNFHCGPTGLKSSMPRQTEPNANNALGSLLQDMLPRGQVRSENTQAISGQAGLRPDIIITAPGRSPVVVEVEYTPARTVEPKTSPFRRIASRVREVGWAWDGAARRGMNQAVPQRLNITLTQKAILILILVFAPTACNVDSTGVDGQCIDDRTGEPLKQVRDVDGQLRSVEKAVEELGTLTLEYCGVTINVPLGGEATYNTDGEVYHPGTGEPIRVEKPYRDMRKFAFPSGYSWD